MFLYFSYLTLINYLETMSPSFVSLQPFCTHLCHFYLIIRSFSTELIKGAGYILPIWVSILYTVSLEPWFLLTVGKPAFLCNLPLPRNETSRLWCYHSSFLGSIEVNIDEPSLCDSIQGEVCHTPYLHRHATDKCTEPLYV